MATNAGTQSESGTEGTETDPQDGTQDQQGQSTSETLGQDGTDQQPDDKGDEGKDKSKPDPKHQSLLADLNKSRNETRSARGRITTLEAEVADLKPKAEMTDAIQTRYDRLEAFVQAAGGSLGKALDSRSFTKALFESDEDVAEIVKRWSQANPSATQQALSSTAAQTHGGRPSLNDAIRAARGNK